MQWRSTVSSISGAGKTRQVGCAYYIISCKISCIFSYHIKEGYENICSHYIQK